MNNSITSNTNSISSLNTKVNDISQNVSTINSSLSTINSNISSLQNYDSNQTTLNTQVSNDITTLYNSKQNLLSDTNKLNPAYIDAGTGSLTTTKMQNLSSITSDLQTQLNSKQATITDGSLTIAKTSGLQTALDSKQATITDGSLTIARTSGLQTALDSKKTIDSTYGFIHSVVDKGALGSVAGNLVLTTSDIGKYIRFTTAAARIIVLPSLTGVPDGAWIGISCSSAGGTSYAITIQNASGAQVLANYNANNTTISAGGNGKAVIVIGGTWVAMAN
jgi:prophage DNA circulation protein